MMMMMMMKESGVGYKGDEEVACMKKAKDCHHDTRLWLQALKDPPKSTRAKMAYVGVFLGEANANRSELDLHRNLSRPMPPVNETFRPPCN